MKGIFLNNLEKKEEGYEYVKKGLRYDITSHICWHVYGLLHRADKNYEEAAKCYANALKFHKTDIQILRDLAVLQTQLRQYDALIETRTQLLQQKPDNPPFWIGLAIAYQLVGKPDVAVSVLKAHEESLKDVVVNYENSELLMYHNWLLEETGDYQAALEHLDGISSKVTDKRGMKEKRALYLAKLGKVEEAEKAYRQLINENPYDGRYVRHLLSAKGLDKEDKRAQANELLAELASEYPRSKAIEDLVLTNVSGEVFEAKVRETLQKALRKGVPSLFTSMKKYYADADKQRAIETAVLGFAESLEKKGTFDGKENGAKEPPTAMLWTLYYLAQHYDFHRQLEKALGSIDKAIAHTPTVVELYMTKGRILKHAGEVEKAAAVMNDARELDLQDRFINSKCAKYMLRAGKIEEAEKILGLFTRRDVTPVQDLADMQCQWFNVEEGYAFLRNKEYGKALKRFHTVDKFFADYFDDQFDFHSYCLRKMTLRSYVSTLRFEDKIRDHPFYVKAVKGAVQAYLAIADKPKATNGVDGSGVVEGLSEAEKKKARNKARKAELKAQKENEAKKAPVKEEVVKQKHDPKKPVDQDPHGEQYLKTTTPLEDALRLVEPLEQIAPDLVDTYVLGFDIYIRQDKWLLALRSLVKTSQLDKTHPSLKPNLAKFQEAVAKVTLDENVKQVIDKQLQGLTKI
ncbi:hypothetical protein EC973_007341 [Apophysomyces ossiformis]|uniref:Uncharacterized protein n=1 Tax=Apophysomyces ossiformis TaxID=679940 RepID=A0A8H7BU11_9FUNG|nr:hypothetical protein EC973_007341 [Apophysomyces ossiformis]